MCHDTLENPLRTGSPEGVPQWTPDTEPQPELVLEPTALYWDPVIEYDCLGRVRGVCSGDRKLLGDPSGADRDDLLLTHWIAQSPSIRIADGVPYETVEWLLDRLRREGMTHVALRRVDVSSSGCSIRSLGVARAGWPDVGESLPSNRLRPGLLAFFEPRLADDLGLEIIERVGGWEVRSRYANLAPGCETSTPAEGITVSFEDGLEGISECVATIKTDFPESAGLALFPAPERSWGSVAEWVEGLGAVAGDLLLLPPSDERSGLP